MAPANEYVSGGGKLKIKGAPVLEGRVGKKGNKKRKKEKERGKDKEGGNEGPNGSHDEGADGMRMKSGEGEGAVRSDGDWDVSRSRSRSRSRGVSEGFDKALVSKTEAERRYEEARRKRLDERFKREGFKTHKERVEELNRYLSNLSEHHDMPRIGPG
ncbi:hypothetical protein HCBG_02949 [Histoplasma capsulatum G186AR]|uniref:DUF1754-domain-containing protein n=2 Tax=Ajellomyces capsulatus TaxID=5037 RepID=C0NHX7_AJECG|nr:uncharacterized protein HCBG_02949 [Histoplasma capsulatum G186AR]EEH09412.1 hypothetical protein HCBG_02949 [Histoplasma capsulatum G186AR]